VHIFTYKCAKSQCGCGFVRVCVYVYIYTYMYEKTPCVHAECAHTNTYMSVLVSCLQMSFICVCRYIHIYMKTWKTPWVDSDTLRAHRYTCTRICVCAWVCMYTHVYIYILKETVCSYEFTYVCVYTCIYVRRLHMWVRKYLNVCMSV